MPCIITLLSVFFVRLPFVSFSLYLYILSHFSFSVSYAPDILPPMPPLTSSAPAVGAIPIPHFPVSFFSKSSLLVLILIYFLSLLLHLHLLLALMAVLLRKVCFSFFSLFFFNLSFYSSRYLPRYPGLLQAGYLCSELHALLLFPSYYQGRPYFCLI